MSKMFETKEWIVRASKKDKIFMSDDGIIDIGCYIDTNGELIVFVKTEDAVFSVSDKLKDIIQYMNTEQVEYIYKLLKKKKNRNKIISGQIDRLYLEYEYNLTNPFYYGN